MNTTTSTSTTKPTTEPPQSNNSSNNNNRDKSSSRITSSGNISSRSITSEQNNRSSNDSGSRISSNNNNRTDNNRRLFLFSKTQFNSSTDRKEKANDDKKLFIGPLTADVSAQKIEKGLKELKVETNGVTVSLGKFSGRNYAIVEVKGKESREDVIRRVGRVIERKYSTKVTKFQKYETRRERAMREGGQNLVRERERREEESRKIIREKERENEEKFACGSQNQETYGPWYQEKSMKKQAPPRQQQKNNGPWHQGNMHDFFHKIGNKENYANHHRREWAYREDLAQKTQDWNALQGLLRKLDLDLVTTTAPASTSLASPTSAPFPYKSTTARYENGWGSSRRNPARL